MTGFSFKDFSRFTRHMPTPLVLDLFAGFGENSQREFWDDLGREMQARRDYEHADAEYEERCLGVDGVAPPELRDFQARLRPKPEPPPFMAGLSRTIEKRQSLDDYLLAIPAQEYIERIAHVPADRKVIYCPLPDHDDTRTPNFYVHDYNWICYACGNSGRIYQFAGLMWGYSLPLRGKAFNEVFERLCSVFRLD